MNNDDRFIWTASDISMGIVPLSARAAGGPGSGFFGHAGRPGEVGGSAGNGAQVEVDGKTFKVVLPDRAKHAGDVLVNVNVEALDKGFAKDQGFYIDTAGTNRIGTRYDRVGEFIKTAKSVEASEVNVYKDGRVTFLNGRHRFAYLRDRGVLVLPVAMSKESAKNAGEHGIVVDVRALGSLGNPVVLYHYDVEDLR